MKEPAQVAYEAWCASRDPKRRELLLSASPRWNNLTHMDQDAWRAAVAAVELTTQSDAR